MVLPFCDHSRGHIVPEATAHGAAVRHFKPDFLLLPVKRNREPLGGRQKTSKQIQMLRLHCYL